MAELAERSTNHIPANEFQANFHLNVRTSWGLADYKAHAPNCSCRHMRELRNNHSSPNNNPLNNLLVVAKPIGKVYFSEGTDIVAYKDDAQSCEMKLANELFSGGVPHDTQVKPKVSCANCLLTANDKKNGFIGIFSHSLEELQATVQSARDTESMEKEQGVVHSRNHADFVVALEVSSLQSLLQEDSVQATNEVLNQIIESGITTAPYHGVQVTMTHPLEVLLTSISWSSSFEYMLVWGFIDGETKVQLDLIGGKRHLGESTIECAIRKADKECSLKIDEGWLKSQVSNKYGGSLTAEASADSEVKIIVPRGREIMNVFFIMPPPQTWNILELVEGALDSGYGRDSEYDQDYGDLGEEYCLYDKSKKIGKNKKSGKR